MSNISFRFIAGSIPNQPYVNQGGWPLLCSACGGGGMRWAPPARVCLPAARGCLLFAVGGPARGCAASSFLDTAFPGSRTNTDAPIARAWTQHGFPVRMLWRCPRWRKSGVGRAWFAPSRRRLSADWGVGGGGECFGFPPWLGSSLLTCLHTTVPFGIAFGWNAVSKSKLRPSSNLR